MNFRVKRKGNIAFAISKLKSGAGSSLLLSRCHQGSPNEDKESVLFTLRVLSLVKFTCSRSSCCFRIPQITFLSPILSNRLVETQIQRKRQATKIRTHQRLILLAIPLALIRLVSCLLSLYFGFSNR